MTIWVLGDIHNAYDHIQGQIEAADAAPSALIFLGDLCCTRPVEEHMAGFEDAGIRCWFIAGNHDTDTEANSRFLLDSPYFRERDLHRRVVLIDGFRVAGLGGVFREEIWHPKKGGELPEYYDYADYRRWLRYHSPCHSDRLRRHRSSIFYGDWLALARQRADILVTHEAPDCHPHGFETITALARAMNVKHAFHGHHHDDLDYRAQERHLGFSAHGVGICGIKDQNGGVVLAGALDEHWRNRRWVRTAAH